MTLIFQNDPRGLARPHSLKNSSHGAFFDHVDMDTSPPCQVFQYDANSPTQAPQNLVSRKSTFDPSSLCPRMSRAAARRLSGKSGMLTSLIFLTCSFRYPQVFHYVPDSARWNPQNLVSLTSDPRGRARARIRAPVLGNCPAC